MAKLWAGLTSGEINKVAEEFNASIPFDSRMYSQDIKGSMAHAAMLSECGIITPEESQKIISGLEEILAGINNGSIKIDMDAEDIHTFVEQLLTEKIGDTGKKLHTARSRNDQVALDVRLYLRDEIDEISELLKAFVSVIADKADEYKKIICPGYTHLQRAQPINFGHHLAAYGMMLLRDIDRIADCRKRLNISPIGSCALAGTTYKTDRFFEANKLGFDGVCRNSIDGVSDRDFSLELLSVISIIMMHLSRFAEEMILWSSFEFGYVKLSDDYTTGSSMMPQKKNPDMAELIRGKTGRVYGDMLSLFTTLKGLPLAYNKDMQEDKERVFDACDTVKMSLKVFAGMVSTMSIRPERMKAAAQGGFINATDLADYLVGKGMPFRDAYKVSGKTVAYCTENGKVLEELQIEEFKQFSDLFDDGVYDAINIENCMNKRISFGGTSTASVSEQVKYLKESIK